MRVLELDQWTACSDKVPNLSFDEIMTWRGESVPLSIMDVRIHTLGMFWTIRIVRKDEQPMIGYCWFIEGPDGKLKLWKSNYDSSD
jgi:hypothetical protein